MAKQTFHLRSKSLLQIAIWSTSVLCPAATHCGEPVARSAHYTLQPAQPSRGGGWASSFHYRVYACIGTPVGHLADRDRKVELAVGFVATLNDPPVASSDTLFRFPGQTAKTAISDLLANDVDPDGDRLHVTRLDERTFAGGRVSMDNGWILYEPADPLPQEDTFTYTVEDSAGHTVRQMVVVRIRGPQPAPSLNLVQIQILPDGRRSLILAGIPGQPYAIQANESLTSTNWLTLEIVHADARGLVFWTDPTLPPPAMRFYRLVAP
ncbi:Ig-like domain-containing protein [Limisphaera sp. 4302-co]|uniref:Ig-like domain-containing protein n=1 Tax=Limisphaera sp. 4302-co TaxID=3400417 RepID=UPI003C1BA9B0